MSHQQPTLIAISLAILLIQGCATDVPSSSTNANTDGCGNQGYTREETCIPKHERFVNGSPSDPDGSGCENFKDKNCIPQNDPLVNAIEEETGLKKNKTGQPIEWGNVLEKEI